MHACMRAHECVWHRVSNSTTRHCRLIRRWNGLVKPHVSQVCAVSPRGRLTQARHGRIVRIRAVFRHNFKMVNSHAAFRRVHNGHAIVTAPFHALPCHHKARVDMSVWVWHIAMRVAHEKLEHTALVQGIAAGQHTHVVVEARHRHVCRCPRALDVPVADNHSHLHRSSIGFVPQPQTRLCHEWLCLFQGVCSREPNHPKIAHTMHDKTVVNHRFVPAKQNVPFVWVNAKVVRHRRCARGVGEDGVGRQRVLTIVLHKPIAILIVHGTNLWRAQDPVVVVARNGEERARFGLGRDGRKHLLGGRTRTVVEIVAQNGPKLHGRRVLRANQGIQQRWRPRLSFKLFAVETCHQRRDGGIVHTRVANQHPGHATIARWSRGTEDGGAADGDVAPVRQDDRVQGIVRPFVPEAIRVLPGHGLSIHRERRCGVPRRRDCRHPQGSIGLGAKPHCHTHVNRSIAGCCCGLSSCRLAGVFHCVCRP
eukprot:m.192411 g.192411  ORF g.192411 m.192411 type:complete len:479 (+) comp18633_c0_seq1:183-1619(+)